MTHPTGFEPVTSAFGEQRVHRHFPVFSRVRPEWSTIFRIRFGNNNCQYSSIDSIKFESSFDSS